MADPVLAAQHAISVPADALVLLIGAAGSGKSTFARRHFPDEAVVSSDRFRGLLAGDEADQRVTDAAFDLLHLAVGHRLEAGLLTVVDATNVDLLSRATPLGLARGSRRPAVAIVFALPAEVCLARNATRRRAVRPTVVRRQIANLRHIRTDLEGQGYAAIHIFGSESDVESAVVVHQPPPLPLPMGEGTTGEMPDPAGPAHRPGRTPMLRVYRWVFNPLLAWLLRSPLHWLASGRVMLITYTGRRTGRRITIPVSYRTSGSEISVTVGQPSRKQWWKNLTTESPVELQLRGRRLQAMARAVRDGHAVRVLVRLT